MEEKREEVDIWYRGSDLMDHQKKLLYQKLMDEIKKQSWEIVYFLNRKDKNSERRDLYIKELEHLQVTHQKPERQKRLQEKITYTTTIQKDILKVLHPLYCEVFDQIAKEISPGPAYNNELQIDVRLDVIFWEWEIIGATEASRDNYWLESAYRCEDDRFKKKLAKRKEEIKKTKEKVRLPLDHKLIDNNNYLSMTLAIIKKMESYIPQYMSILGIDTQDNVVCKRFVQKYILYVFIKALIEEKLVFDIKSTKSKKCLDGSIEEIVWYFQKTYWSELTISPIEFKRKLRHNNKSNTDPMDLSYTNVTLEDINMWEEYLNTTYFLPHNINIQDLRIKIMQEYNSGKWLIEKTFELLNPRYYIYKDDMEKHNKHLAILQEHQKKTTEWDPHIATIIKEIEEKLAFSQTKKQEHTKLEEKFEGMQSKPQYCITQIQQQYLKKYKVPIQYRHIFGIIISKMNNFYKSKKNIAKKSDKINQELFERLFYSDREQQQFSYYLHNYMTFGRMDEILNKKWSEKWKNRILEIKNACIYGDKIKRKKTIKSWKKWIPVGDNQLFLDFNCV